MDFVDRDQELRRLWRLSDRKEGSLAIVWGRRRIGKTRLLLEWVRKSGGLYWVADESAAPIQRRYLAEAIEGQLPAFGQVEYPDWQSLLRRLARDAKQARWRGPLVIDEVPYLLGPSPELASALQRFVDHEAKEANLVLALVGSSQRMMQGLALAADAPLYGRAQEIMKLQPLPVGHLAEVLSSADPARVVEAYALWGGIARYWELAAPFHDSREAADALVLDPLGPLHEEPARLLLEERPPALALRPVLDAIGAGAHRLSEIAGRLGQPATSLARPLMRLQELDLVVRDVPFGEPERSGKRALYKLGDPFTRLWFSTVAPRRGFLAQATRKARLRLLDEALPRLWSVAWEELCRQAVPHLSHRLGGIDWGRAQRYWHGAGPEWDVVAEGAGGRALLAGEVKWNRAEASPAGIAHAVQALLAKGVPAGARPGAEVHHAVFVAHAPRRWPGLRGANVQLVTAGDVVSALK